MNIKTLIEFLDEYGLQGSYSGGGDSGGIEEFDTVHPIRKGDDRIDMNELQEWVYSETLSEYGGWAWNGDASGSIIYNKESKSIIVSGDETSDDDLIEQKSAELSLLELFTEQDKKRVDSVNIYASDYEDDLRVRINVTNGPWTESLQKAEDEIVDKLKSIIEEYNDDYRYYVDQPYELNEKVVISFGLPHSEEKEWTINLQEMLQEKEVEND